MDEQSSEPIRYADIDSVVIDESKIPEKFRHLTKYAKAWSIADDSIRSYVMAHTTYEEKKEFVDAVEPFFSDIKDWCDDYFGQQDVPDEVFLFQMMFEPLAEALIDILSCSLDDRPED